MSRIYLRATSGRAVAELSSWRAAFIAARKVWGAYCISVGADTYLQFFSHEAPTSFSFKTNEPPPMWTKPSGRHQSATPKKGNKAEWDELKALPYARPTHELADIFQLPSSYEYSTDTGSGWSRLGNSLETWRVSWTDRDMFLVGPDPRPVLEKYADLKFDVGDGRLPLDHFELTSEARVDLLFAEAAVRLEDANTPAAQREG